nr:hypothetical protein [Tanacetum cinerariifolium]
FAELPFKEEILAFLRELGHGGEIKRIADVNIKKQHQPWRSLAEIINKCLSGKSTGYDSLRLSQAQILWGMYHKKNVDFAYLQWEDFVYQVEHKDTKKSNEMYYPRFTKVIVNFFMTKDQSIPKGNKYGSILPIELMDEAITNFKSYKEYYAIASRAEPPKIKESIKKKQIKSDDEEISWKSSEDDDDEVKISKHDDDVDDQSDDDYQNDQDDDDDQDFSTHDKEDKDEEIFDPIVQTGRVQLLCLLLLLLLLSVPYLQFPLFPANEEDDGNELYEDVNINLDGRDIQMAEVHTTQVIEDTHVTLTLVNPKDISSIPGIVDKYLDHRMNKAMKVAVQLQSDRLEDEAQAENEDFLNKLDENNQKIIKEQVKEQVKTSHAVAADLSELELKKIIIDNVRNM